MYACVRICVWLSIGATLLMFCSRSIRDVDNVQNQFGVYSHCCIANGEKLKSFEMEATQKRTVWPISLFILFLYAFLCRNRSRSFQLSLFLSCLDSRTVLARTEKMIRCQAVESRTEKSQTESAHMHNTHRLMICSVLSIWHYRLNCSINWTSISSFKSSQIPLNFFWSLQ